MRKMLPLAVVLALFASDRLAPRVRLLCKGFLPPNNLSIPVGSLRAAGLSKAQFDAVLDRALSIYGPIIAARGGRLDIERDWQDPTVNASAERIGSIWRLNMYGGLARHPAVTPDGFSLVVCHELGHHLGGYPKLDGDWATNEGGADYFATLKCLRRLLPATTPETVDPTALRACSGVFRGEARRTLCLREAMAGLSLGALLAQIGGSPLPKLDTPDPGRVSQTNDDHPAAQCRLDTYFQGGLCVKPVGEEVSDDDPNPGACTRSQGFSVGLRPLCWYKPPASQREIPEVARLSVDPQVVLKRLEALRASLRWD
ncbi:MAG: hypothetical protein KGO96_04915 [Elusimicrobia bacterium]|nr:hypothetical protein [Elusimicrobiota bacterium]MDE2236420.1 hypothetical protein [Elusimicrobiota bacterium]MDE2425232.1 hypothetical protein [Elusimicrobiota bacterium]